MERTQPDAALAIVMRMCVDPLDQVKPLLERFTARVADVIPLVALWAHGSLALGDFQPGRSDLDLVAIVAADISDALREQLRRTHEAPSPMRNWRTSCTAPTWFATSWPTRAGAK
jgi:hypothetical protein